MGRDFKARPRRKSDRFLPLFLSFWRSHADDTIAVRVLWNYIGVLGLPNRHNIW
jgi:hypothetical protein